MNTGNIPKIWVQYMNNKDCSEALCSFHCPQWCYVVIPPPPDDPSSTSSFSPIIITIIGVLGGALLLVTYYAIISKYCIKRFSSRRDDRSNNVSVDVELSSIVHEPWFVASNGIDEGVIMSIAMFEYKRGDGLVEGTDSCSVCLSEFVEGERLRLLPKCSHAFHVRCVDTWLRRHSNCPLCRANVIAPASALSSPQPINEQRQEEDVEMDMRDEGRIRRSISVDGSCL